MKLFSNSAIVVTTYVIITLASSIASEDACERAGDDGSATTCIQFGGSSAELGIPSEIFVPRHLYQHENNAELEEYIDNVFLGNQAHEGPKELLRETILQQLYISEFRRKEIRTFFSSSANSHFSDSCLAIRRSCDGSIRTVKIPGTSHPCLVVGRQLVDSESVRDLEQILPTNGTIRTLVIVLEDSYKAEKDQELVDWLWSHVGVGGRLLLLAEPSSKAAERLSLLVDALQNKGMCIRGDSSKNPILITDTEQCKSLEYAPPELCPVLHALGQTFWVSELLAPFVSLEERLARSSDEACKSSTFDDRISVELGRKLNPKIPTYQLGYRVVVVNMPREEEKWKRFVRNAASSMGRGTKESEFHKFDAVVGRDAVLSPFLIKKLFSKNPLAIQEPMNPHEDHGFRKGVLGCSLSHIHIWREMISDRSLEEFDGYVVFEDDATLSGVFRSRWDSTMKAANSDPRWDVMFLYQNNNLYHPSLRVHNKLYAPAALPRSYGGGTAGYVIRKRGARRLFNLAMETGMWQPVDWFMLDAMAAGKVVGYQTVPDMVTTPPAFSEESTTSEPYPLNHDQRVCERQHTVITKTNSVPKLHGLHAIEVTFPKPNQTVRVGDPILMNILVDHEMDSKLFFQKNRCSSLCVSINSPVSPGTSQCRPLYDEKQLILGSNWEFPAGPNYSGVVNLNVALVTNDGQLVEQSMATIPVRLEPPATMTLETREALPQDGEYYDTMPCVADVTIRVPSWEKFSTTVGVDHQLCLYTAKPVSPHKEKPNILAPEGKQWCIRVSSPEFQREFDWYRKKMFVSSSVVVLERLDGSIVSQSNIQEKTVDQCFFWKAIVTVVDGKL